MVIAIGNETLSTAPSSSEIEIVSWESTAEEVEEVQNTPAEGIPGQGSTADQQKGAPIEADLPKPPCETPMVEALDEPESGMGVEALDGLLGVSTNQYDELPLSDSLWWFKEGITKFVKGGIYLVAGQPGIGKSTLAIQVALELGRGGRHTVYILTEQSKEDLARRARLMTADLQGDHDTALGGVHAEDGIYDVETLPRFLMHEVLNPGGKYFGTDMIVVDSVQGQGVSATSTRTYRQIYEFCRQCKAAGVTVMLVCHVTKRGDIAGPKDLEHNVDCVIVMKKAMAYRPLFVPKNRFGPAVIRPIALQMDRDSTCLKKAAHSQSLSTVARSFWGKDMPIPEIQAAVSLPSYGSRGRITAPGLPRKEIEQLTNCISQLPDMEIEDLEYMIHCRLPGGMVYQPNLGLALAMCLIGSYIQRPVPRDALYLGEIDLLRQVRGIGQDTIVELMDAIKEGKVRRPVRLFLPKSSSAIAKQSASGTPGVTIVFCPRLDDAVYETWPEMKSSVGSI